MKTTSTKHLVYLALLCALAIILNLFESIVIGPIYGYIRLGLANIVALITIRLFGAKDTIIVNILRIVIANLIRGSIFGSMFWIGAGGVILSTIVLIVLNRTSASAMFMSIISAIAHSLGQVLVVVMLYKQTMMLAVLPYLLIGSIATGVLTGIVARLTLQRLGYKEKQEVE